MTCAKGIVGALAAAWEAADAAICAVVDEGVASLGDNLMGICLMAHIPHYAVVGCGVDIVQRYGQLYGAEARTEVTRVCGATLDDVSA